MSRDSRDERDERPPSTRRRRRRLRFTREGKYFVALTFAIGFAAINTGNNLLYLVLGMLLALIVGSGILSEISLRALGAERQPAERLFAETPFLMGISLHNDKRQLPSFSIEVEDLLAEAPLDKKCYFLKVPAGQTQRTSYRHVFPRRGRYRLHGFAVSTRFPFGLFEKTRRLEGAQELLVYPRIVPINALPPRHREAGEEHGAALGRVGEFHALRDYREGDDPRDIAWRNSARLGRPLVREHEDPRGQQVTIFLDNLGEGDARGAALDEQEEAVTRAASYAAHFIRTGFRVALVARSFTLPPGAGQAHLDAMLGALALVSFAPDEGVVPPLPADALRVGPGAPGAAS